MKNSRKAVAAVVIVAAAGGVIAGVANGESDEIPQDLLAIAGTPLSQLPPAAAASIQGDVTDNYGLDTSQAKSVPAPAGDAEAGDTWTIIPGKRGVCVSFPSGSLTCGAAKEFAAGRILSTQLPAATGAVKLSSGDNQLSADELVGPGPATFRGLAPEGVTRVSVVGRDGKELASTEVSGNAYQLQAPSARAYGAVHLTKADGSTLVVAQNPS